MDLLLFGDGQIAELADFYFEHDSPHRVRAFSVDGTFLKATSFHGKPVVALEDIANDFPPERCLGRMLSLTRDLRLRISTNC